MRVVAGSCGRGGAKGVRVYEKGERAFVFQNHRLFELHVCCSTPLSSNRGDEEGWGGGKEAQGGRLSIVCCSEKSKRFNYDQLLLCCCCRREMRGEELGNGGRKCTGSAAWPVTPTATPTWGDLCRRSSPRELSLSFPSVLVWQREREKGGKEHLVAMGRGAAVR